jgi:5-methylthioribose kinase
MLAQPLESLMREVTAENAANYLRETRRVRDDRSIRVRELSGGVSNIVLRVDVKGQEPFVLKQSRAQLRTRADWFSRLDRIWIERAAMDVLTQILPPRTVPEILFDDRENYLFAMSCAPDDSGVWKEQLLAGKTDPSVARSAGATLGTIHAETRGRPPGSPLLTDTLVFDQLRIDPYYRRIALVHSDLREPIQNLIESMSAAPVKTLVHADFSPKNILVHSGGLTLLDFETAHYGDPAFDLGFFLTHLLLKAFRSALNPLPYLTLIREFWSAYDARMSPGSDLVRRAMLHTGACVLARIDGKSPVDYCDALDVDAVRRFGHRALMNPLPDAQSLLEIAAQDLRTCHRSGVP